MKLSERIIEAAVNLRYDSGHHLYDVFIELSEKAAKLEAKIKLLSKDYSTICAKCGYMRPATKVEKENTALKRGIVDHAEERITLQQLLDLPTAEEQDDD